MSRLHLRCMSTGYAAIAQRAIRSPREFHNHVLLSKVQRAAQMRKTKKISGQKRPNPKKEALLLSWEHDLESSESERFFACTRDRLLFKLVFLISPFLACSSATWKGNEIHLYEVHFTETLIIFSLSFSLKSKAKNLRKWRNSRICFLI